MNPLSQAFRALGPRAATAAGALAVAAPWFLKNDDRGYLQTAAFTTPLIAAGFTALPGAMSGVWNMSTEIGQLWSNRAFLGQDYPQLLKGYRRQGTSVRRSMHKYVQAQGQDWYASIRPTQEDWSGQAFDLLGKYRNQAKELRQSVHGRGAGVSAREFRPQIEQDLKHRILLSRTVEEARMAGLTPEKAAERSHLLQPKLRSWDQIEQVVKEHSGNQDFLRTFARRAQRLDDLNLGKRVSGAQLLKTSTYERQNLGFAIMQARQAENGHLLKRLQLAEEAIHNKWIQKADVIYQGEQAIGLELFNHRGRSFNLPLIGSQDKVVSMGPGWNHRGTFAQLWDEKGIRLPDISVLENLSDWKDAKQAAVSSFQWGGITDRTDTVDAALHEDLKGSVSPKWALAERSLRANPDPFGTHAGGKRWKDLTDAEKHAAEMSAMEKYDLTKVGGEGGIAFGKLESRLAEGNSIGLVPSPTHQDPGYRSFSKDFYIDPESIKDLDKPHLSSTFFKEQLGVEAGEMPEFSARFGEITPQVKSMYGDIPAEAERAAQEAVKEDRRFLLQAKRAHIDHLQDLVEKGKGVIRHPQASKDVIGDIQRDIEHYNHQIRSLKSKKLSQLEMRQQFGATREYLEFQGELQNKLRTALGPEYETHLTGSLLKHIQRGAEATEAERVLAGQVSQRVLRELVADPLNIIAARGYQTLGETIFNTGDRLSGVKGMLDRKLSLSELWQEKGAALQQGDVIGFDEHGKPIAARTESVVQDVVGNDVILRERFGIAGAKGEGPGAKGLFHSAIYNKEDLLPRQVRLNNLVTELTGVGGVIPEQVEGLALAEYSAFKTKNPMADLLEVSVDIAEQLVKGKHLKSEQFLQDLQNNHFIYRNGRYEEQFADVYQMSRQDAAQRYYDLSKKAEHYLDDVGNESGHFVLDAFQRTTAAQQRAGRQTDSLSQWVFKNYRQGAVRLWDHTRLNRPAQTGVTYDMLYEMQRAGHTEGMRDIFENIRYPQGDPAMAREVQNYLAAGDYVNKPIGAALQLDEIENLDYRLSTIESRMGKSVFNPEFAPNNLSIDLGGVLKEVKLGGESVNLRYLPKLGMDAYKGGANAYGSGEWAASELEHGMHDALSAAAGIDWANPESHQMNNLRTKVSEYMEKLSTELGGKDGVLRADMTHRAGIYGVAAERSSSVGGTAPFEMSIPKSMAEGIEDQALRTDVLSGNGYAALFRDPNSAAMYMRVRVDPTAHLDPNEFGIHSRVRSAFQMDHDKDWMKALFVTKQGALEEARKAITDQASPQWQNLLAAEMFQGTENPQNITGRAFAAEAEEKGWSGAGNYLDNLRKGLSDSVEASRAQSFRARLFHGYTGHFSNMTTRLQLMLANSPDLLPGDRDYSAFSSLLFDVRQTAISAGKGKMGVGAEPLAVLANLNKSINQGEAGLDLFQQSMSMVARGTGFTGIYDQAAADVTGVGLEEARNILGNESLQFGDEANNLLLWTKGGHGRESMRKLLASPNNLKAKRLTSYLTRGEISVDDALEMSQIRDMSPEMIGGILKQRSSSGVLHSMAESVAGESGGRMSDRVSRTLGMLNEGAREGWSSAGKTLKPAGKVLAAGLGLAAIAGVMTATASSNKYRPEEEIGVNDQIPGEPVAGSRASVNPKRTEQPARPSPRTIVAANMRHAVDLEIRAKTPDHASSVEMAKNIQRFTDTGGVSNVTVQHSGGWQKSASKLRMQERIREELDKHQS